MKKAAFCLLACVLFLCSSIFAVSAESLSAGELVSGDYGYSFNEDGTAVITRYSGKQNALTVPKTLEGVPVTAIGPNAFQANDALT